MYVKQIENNVNMNVNPKKNKSCKNWVIHAITEAVVQTLDEISVSLPPPQVT